MQKHAKKDENMNKIHCLERGGERGLKQQSLSCTILLGEGE